MITNSVIEERMKIQKKPEGNIFLVFFFVEVLKKEVWGEWTGTKNNKNESSFSSKDEPPKEKQNLNWLKVGDGDRSLLGLRNTTEINRRFCVHA